MNQPANERSRARTIARRGAVCVITVLILSLLIVQSIRAFPKPFNSPAPAVRQTTPTVTMTPAWLLTPRDFQVIQYLANQISLAGVPIRVVIREVPAKPIDVGADATERANFYPVESTKGADDGLLMMVEIPANDHTQTQVAFATGKYFYPNGGLTPAALTEIKYQRIQPLIAKNTIGPAISAGLNWIAWTNQFESSPRLVPTSGQRRVARAVDLIFVPLLGLYALFLIVMAFRTRAQARRAAAAPEHSAEGREIPRDSVHLGALARGRVDDPVMVGVLLQLVAHGAIAVDGNGSRASSIQLLDASACQTEPQRQMYDLLARIADSTSGRVSAKTLRQLPDLWSPIRRRMSNQFETSGLFTAPVPPGDRRLRRLCLVGLILSGAALIDATPSMARWGILAAAVLAIVSTIVWWWSRHRQFATDAGRSAVQSPDRYLPRNESEAIELSIFRWIVTLDLSPSRLAGGGTPSSLATDGVRAAAARLNTTVLSSYAA